MSLGVARVQRFGGLRLASDPGEVGLEACVACSNVELADDLSYVRSRDGLLRLTSLNALGASSSRCLRVIAGAGSSAASKIICASYVSPTVYVDEVDTSSWTVTALGSFTASGMDDFIDAVNIGTPTVSTTFIATGTATLRKVSASTLASSVGKPRFLGVLSDSNRLIQGRFAAAADSPTGANGSTSTVFFSDAGAPETFGANNYVHLRPGDGEALRGIVTWRGQTFVFKETAAFVFGPESTDEDGNPVFDYRAISLPARVFPSEVGQIVTAGADGVYFWATDGVYRTTGGPPVRVSGDLTTISADWIATAGHRVLAGATTGAAILSTRNGQWVSWAWDPDTYAPSLDVNGSVLLAGPRELYALSGTTDDGVAIASSYQSGYSDLGSPTPKVVRRSEVWGTGTATYAMGVDYGTPDSGTSLTLGTSPTADNAFESTARRGTNHCFKLSASSGAWRCNAVNLMFTKPGPAGVAR